jgi:hypothetical protein
MEVKLGLRMLKSRVLMKIFEPKRYGIREDWRKLKSEVHHDLYPTPDIIQVIKPRAMRQEGGGGGHAAHRGERRDAYRAWVGKPDGIF